MLFALEGAVEQGLLFAIMALGVYLTFRILDFPDLTVDGSFALGGAVAARMIVSGYPPLVATACAIVAGFSAGTFTGFIHTKGRISGLLAGILTMTALYSLNLRIMGKSNTPLLQNETLVTYVQGLDVSDVAALVGVFLITVGAVKFALDWFLQTELGLAIRATGNNERMIRSLGANTDQTKIVGLAVSNGMVAFSGALVAQYQGFADVGMGIGMIIVGLASVIIGEALFGSSSIRVATLAVIGGSVVYRLAIATALRIGLAPTDLKLITAFLVIFALSFPRIKEITTTRKVGSDASVGKRSQDI